MTFSYNPTTGVVCRNGKPLTSRYPNGYLRTLYGGKEILLHRLAWFLYYNEWPEKPVDHINGIRDDNRINNLRLATYSENNRNAKIKTSNTSGVKCVYWHKARQKWCVQLRTNFGRISFGLHDDLEFAELVANEARDKYHLEFARNI